jgi:hypothetical protein
MHFMRRLLCLLAFALAAAPAWAQDTSPERPPTSDVLAVELISAAGAVGVFEAVASDPRTVIVRHTRSGLVCRMSADHSNRIVIFPQAARGEDVACESEHDGVSVRLFATRYSFSTSLDEQVLGAGAAIERMYPGAQPLNLAQSITEQGLPPHRTVAYLISRRGTRSFTSASVCQIGEWVLKLRYTAPAADDASARARETEANALWRTALRDVGASRTP